MSLTHELILGQDWLREVNPQINWKSGEQITRPNLPAISALQAFSSLEVATHIDDDDQLIIVRLNAVNTTPTDESREIRALLTEYEDVFPTQLPAGLPPARSRDHAIDLVPGTTPPHRPPYRLSHGELEELKHQIDHLLSQGFIRPSSSPFGAPILFVKKKDKTLRMCVDYRALNALTIKNKYPLPRIDDLLDTVQGGKFFSTIDLLSDYSQVRVKPEDTQKTAFQTRLGSFEYLVMPFGLTNAPATFMHLMNNVFHDSIGKFVIVYLDDILIYSRTFEEHLNHIRHVLQRLREHKLYAGAKKCHFARTSVNFLGFVVSQQGISPVAPKVDAINMWPIPTNATHVKSFLGLVNYYRVFIANCADIAGPLTNLTSSTTTFKWSEECQKAFQDLKEAITAAPCRKTADPLSPFFIRTDASDFAIGGVLEQEDEQQRRRPIAFFSAKLNQHEKNYTVREKGVTFTVETDHKTLETFITQKTFTSQRETRWYEKITAFDFKIIYRKGEKNVVADALSRRTDFLNTIQATIADSEKTALRRHTRKDPFLSQFLITNNDKPLSPAFVGREGLVFNIANGQDRLCIPAHNMSIQRILREAHDSPSGGHLGIEKTLKAAASRFYWKRMSKSVKDYITSCDSCQKRKSEGKKRQGLLQPLPIPNDTWREVSMDFITKLPSSAADGNDTILTIVDRLSKMAHFSAMKETDTAEEVAKIFIRDVFRLHGMPEGIVSNRDPRFTGKFWACLWKELGTKLRMSIAYHPETDGQSERTNRTIEEILRHYVNNNKTNWEHWLPTAEFAYNSAVNSSTGYSPFQAVRDTTLASP